MLYKSIIVFFFFAFLSKFFRIGNKSQVEVTNQPSFINIIIGVLQLSSDVHLRQTTQLTR